MSRKQADSNERCELLIDPAKESLQTDSLVCYSTGLPQYLLHHD